MDKVRKCDMDRGLGMMVTGRCDCVEIVKYICPITDFLTIGSATSLIEKSQYDFVYESGFPTLALYRSLNFLSLTLGSKD